MPCGCQGVCRPLSLDCAVPLPAAGAVPALLRAQMTGWLLLHGLSSVVCALFVQRICLCSCRYRLVWCGVVCAPHCYCTKSYKQLSCFLFIQPGPPTPRTDTLTVPIKHSCTHTPSCSYTPAVSSAQLPISSPPGCCPVTLQQLQTMSYRCAALQALVLEVRWAAQMQCASHTGIQ